MKKVAHPNEIQNTFVTLKSYMDMDIVIPDSDIVAAHPCPEVEELISNDRLTEYHVWEQHTLRREAHSNIIDIEARALFQ